MPLLCDNTTEEMVNAKKRAYDLIEQLTTGQLSALVELLETMIDPLARSLASAPVEEEEILTETATELDAAHASIARGEGIPHDEVLRKFGIKPR